jgi:hypothetical protein
MFYTCGVTLDQTVFTPFGNRYHPMRKTVGSPFQTRLARATVGLQCPLHSPFICEAYTIHAVVGRELTWPRRFTVADVGTDTVDRHGTCLGVLDAPGDGPTPRTSWIF